MLTGNSSTNHEDLGIKLTNSNQDQRNADCQALRHDRANRLIARTMFTSSPTVLILGLLFGSEQLCKFVKKTVVSATVFVAVN
jgi:hypothetical protein